MFAEWNVTRKKVYWLLVFCFSSFLYINVKECGKGNSSAEVANKQHHFVGCFWWSVLVLLLGNGPEQRCVGMRGRGAEGGWRASEGGCASGLGAFRPPLRCLEASTRFYRILRTGRADLAPQQPAPKAIPHQSALDSGKIQGRAAAASGKMAAAARGLRLSQSDAAAVERVAGRWRAGCAVRAGPAGAGCGRW